MKIRTLLTLSWLFVAIPSACDKGEPDAAPGTPATEAPEKAKADGKDEAKADGKDEAKAAIEDTGSLANFQGELKLSIGSPKAPGESQEITMLIREQQLRMEMPVRGAGPTYQVINIPEGKLWAVIEPQKTVMELDFAALTQQLGGVLGKTPKAQAAPPSPPSKTGRMDTIAGHKCEEWSMQTGEGQKVLVCAADVKVNWLRFNPTDLPKEQAWASSFFNGSKLPLRIVAFDSAGTEEGRIEVKSITRRELPDSQFKIPEGYRRVTMEEMMQGMRAMQQLGAPGQPQQMTPEMQKMIEQMKRQQAAQK